VTRLNYTERKRVKHEHVHLVLAETEHGELLSAEVTGLDGYGFPKDALVILEAQRRYESLRLDMGTVANPVALSEEPLGFDSLHGVVIRLKVIEPGSSGKLLGAADRLRPTSEDDAGANRALLPFRASAELGGEVWRIEFDTGEPIALINSGLSDWNSFARSEGFVALVYPQILRQIAEWVMRSQSPEDGDEASDWARFIKKLGRQDWPDPNDEDAIAMAVDAIVRRFCNLHDFLSMVAMEVQE
jgi:hypothetical protein